VAEQDAHRLSRLGQEVSDHFSRWSSVSSSLLSGRGAVRIERRFAVPELLGSKAFVCWAHFIRLFGKPGSPWRHIGLFFFITSLLAAIIIGIPLIIVGTALLQPLLRKRLDAYVESLRLPTA
jgi:hypothetical protein